MSPGLLLVSLLLAHPDLDEARVAMSALKYRAAVAPLTRLTEDATASDAEVVEGFALLAKAQLALRKPDLAQAAFEGLLRRAPMADEPQGSPALRAAFQKAKKGLFPPKTVRLQRSASSADTLVVEVVNPWRLALTATWVALRPEEATRPVHLDEQRVVMALAPGAAGWLELSSEGEVVAALGSRAQPIEGPPAPVVVDAPTKTSEARLVPAPKPEPLPTPPPPAGPSVRRVAGWGLSGVGIASAIVGLVLIGWGAADDNLASQWPLNLLSLEENSRLQASGQSKLTAGGIVGGVGLAMVIGGVVLLVTE